MGEGKEMARAVRNNARWCDGVCRAHGTPGEFHEAYWIHRGRVPPYTSKLITLTGSSHAAPQLKAIESLIHAGPDVSFSIKDAFQVLELEPLGFRVLFDATWLALPPDAAAPSDARETLQWSLVRDRDELSEWEAAWRGSPANAAGADAPRVFPPSLLHEPGVHFLAGKRAGATVASGALNRTGSVVGLCNVFTGGEDAGPLYPGCVRLARSLYPKLPLVSYARGAELAQAEAAGFTLMHGLTVWQRDAR